MSRYRIFLLAALAGCSLSEPWSKVESKYVQVRIVNIDRPKHFRVDVDSEGLRYEGVGRSKHCNNWRRNHVGDVHTVLRVTYQRPNGERKVEFPHLNTQLCK